MTTEEIKYVATDVGNIPSPSNWMNLNFADSEITDSQETNDTPVMFLEKAVNGQVSMKEISSALDEYKRLYKAGIVSPAEMLTLSRAYPDNEEYAEACLSINDDEDEEKVMIVGGPASVEAVDREGHLITSDALKKAFKKYRYF